ncbi:MAG: trigger factor, partial [Firmicutes bacterium]|nr:trigger factor [Bacillota bacterium]
YLYKDVPHGTIHMEALEILLPDAYDGAVEEAGINPLDRPEIDLVQMEKGKPVIFKATVEVKPEVTLGEYRGIAVSREVHEITDADVENKLSELQSQHVKMYVVEDGVVENGDLTVIDFAGYLDDEPFAGGTAEGYSLEVGSGSFIPGFEEQMIGMKIGEEKDINVTFPAEYQSEELAGKPVVFKVKVNEIKRKELPELTDDFVKEISELDTLVELKEDLLNKLKQQEEERAKSTVEDKIVQVVAASSEVTLPNVLVEREIDRQMKELEQFLQSQGLNVDKFLELAAKTLEDLRQDKREEAEKRVKANLVLDAIIEKEGIEASDEELEERVKKFADSYGQDVQTIKDYFEAQGQLDVIREEIRFRKAIDLLAAEAQITNETAPTQNEE